jgi:hypothetical protein
MITIKGKVFGTQPYVHGIIITEPHTFGTAVTWTPRPSHFGNLITEPKNFGTPVQWVKTPGHFGNPNMPAGVGAVTLTLSGTGSGTTTTDEFESYSFTGLGPGTYTVTPSKAGISFAPTYWTFTIIDSVNGIDFASQGEIVNGVL